MKTRCLAGACILVAGLACSEPVPGTMNPEGAFVPEDSGALARVVIAMHGPGWSHAGSEQATPDAATAGDARGRIPLPPNCRGSLVYTAKAARENDATVLSYDLSFSETTEIAGAYVSFMLDGERAQGKAITLLPGTSDRNLPVDNGDPGLAGTASGVLLARGDGSALLISASTPGAVRVQNNRQYGTDAFEVRFILFGEGPVASGIHVRRKFRLTILPEREAREMAEKEHPETTFDADQPYALLTGNGVLTVMHRRERLVDVRAAMHGPGWSYVRQEEAQMQQEESTLRSRSLLGTFPIPGAQGKAARLAQTVAGAGVDGMDFRYRFEFPETVRLNGYQVSFSIPVDAFRDLTFAVTGETGTKSLTIPSEHGENSLYEGPAEEVTVAPGTPVGFTVRPAEPTRLLVQDNRGWGGDTIEFRFCLLREGEGADVAAGTVTDAAFRFAWNGPLQLVLDPDGVESRTDTADWIPFVLPWDSAPVDVSFLNHKPAGKHGFVTADGGRFTLGKGGPPIRFWGTCFSAGANFPSHEQSEKIARRLAAFGVNIVRTHHADANWAERHFFSNDAETTREFDAENLDRFDYLVHCLKREGIYIYLDQLVHRKFKPGDGVDAADDLENAAKPYSNFDPKLMALQKEFSRAIWTHVNPYTKLPYKDDPAIALMEFANENDLFTQSVTLEPYRTRLESRFREWAAARGIEVADAPVDFTRRTDAVMRFLIDVQKEYYAEMQRYLRDDVGVKVPMTGSNWSRNAALLLALEDVDYTDSHAYWNHPSKDGTFANSRMVEADGTIMDWLGFQRLQGKPFFVSEWDQPWPNEWRAELPLWIAASSAYQDWNGLTVYTYRHSASVPVDFISGAFETFNDPARFGLFPAAALLFRREDVKAGAERLRITMDRDLAASEKSPDPWSSPVFRGLSDVRRFAVDPNPDTDPDTPALGHDAPSPAPPKQRRTDTNEIRRDIAAGTVIIDTPGTQVVQGLLGGKKPLSAQDLDVECRTEFATVAVSSLHETAPIVQAPILLVTAVGRAENTDFTYDVTRTRRLNAGVGPILIDPVRATLRIRTSRRDPVAYAIQPNGERLPLPPAALQAAGNTVTLTIGPETCPAPSIYYLIAFAR